VKGAREYARLFETGQYGRLYIVSGYHARGKTFHIFVLPDGEKAIPNGPNSPPLNDDAVEVYGIIDGNPGWTESYGWLHQGRWQDDFQAMVKDAANNLRLKALEGEETRRIKEEQERLRKLELLKSY